MAWRLALRAGPGRTLPSCVISQGSVALRAPTGRARSPTDAPGAHALLTGDLLDFAGGIWSHPRGLHRAKQDVHVYKLPVVSARRVNQSKRKVFPVDFGRTQPYPEKVFPGI